MEQDRFNETSAAVATMVDLVQFRLRGANMARTAAYKLTGSQIIEELFGDRVELTEKGEGLLIGLGVLIEEIGICQSQKKGLAVETN